MNLQTNIRMVLVAYQADVLAVSEWFVHVLLCGAW